MKTINKFSLALFLLLAVLLSSYALINKEHMTSTTSAAKTHIGTTGIALKVNKDKDVKTRIASCACGQLRVICTGPDPDRIVMCHCKMCQKQTGSPFSVQARFPNEQVKIEGKSTVFVYPVAGDKTDIGRTCADGDVVTAHFCPVCGSTVYYYRKSDTARTGVRVGCFADPTFPAPIGSGFEEYKAPWVMNIESLSMSLGHHN